MGRGYKSYLVFFQCPAQVVDTGARRFDLGEGIYVYVGSCGASCVKRVLRHLERPQTKRWHVDYLNCAPLYAVVTKRSEEEVAACLSQLCPHVPGFGSTDDPANPSHLFQCRLADAIQCV